MINPLNIQPPDEFSPNQIWENDHCVGLVCKDVHNIYGGDLKFINGIVRVGEIYRTKSSHPSTLFILKVIDGKVLQAIDQSKRMTRCSASFLLNTHVCERLI